MRNLTKGEFLTLLGPNSDIFTAFFLDPVTFGITSEQTLMELRVAKQKFDWTNSMDLDLPEIQSFISLFASLGVFSAQNVADLAAVASRSDSGDWYTITIKAMDEITVDNISGAIEDNGWWTVTAIITNNTAGGTSNEKFVYDYPPSMAQIQDSLTAYIKGS